MNQDLAEALGVDLLQVPIGVAEVELAAGELAAKLLEPRRSWSDYAGHRILVRLHGEPIGFVNLADQDEMPRQLTGLIGRLDWESVSRLRTHLREDGIAAAGLEAALAAVPACRAPQAPEPPLTVVICTRDRPGPLRNALDSVLRAKRGPLQILIVDNAPKADGTKRLVAEYAERGVDYVLEPCPGLSRARNAGMAHAKHDLVAFTDDDVVVDPLWVSGLLRGFARDPNVGCVTGMVPAVALETEEQALFEGKVNWGKNCDPLLYGTQPPSEYLAPLYPFNAGVFGTGANFAVRTSTYAAVGAFDETLGAGTVTRGGEDLDFFLRVILHGELIAYEPGALCWHRHRENRDELRQQLRGYGSGTSAYILKHLLRGETRGKMLRGVPVAVQRLPAVLRGARGRPIPKALRRQEQIGLAEGPFLYLKARRGQKRARS